MRFLARRELLSYAVLVTSGVFGAGFALGLVAYTWSTVTWVVEKGLCFSYFMYFVWEYGWSEGWPVCPFDLYSTSLFGEGGDSLVKLFVRGTLLLWLQLSVLAMPVLAFCYNHIGWVIAGIVLGVVSLPIWGIIFERAGTSAKRHVD
jgi:hypothetical protein